MGCVLGTHLRLSQCNFMAVNHYETAPFLLWTSDVYREPKIEHRICPELLALAVAAYHRWSRYPHPIKVEISLVPDSIGIKASCRASAIVDYKESAEIRPIPMINVTPIPSSDDDNLSSHIEVSHFAPDDVFIPQLSIAIPSSFAVPNTPSALIDLQCPTNLPLFLSNNPPSKLTATQWNLTRNSTNSLRSRTSTGGIAKSATDLGMKPWWYTRSRRAIHDYGRQLQPV